jgi:hypothetical protein
MRQEKTKHFLNIFQVMSHWANIFVNCIEFSTEFMLFIIVSLLN